MLPTTPHIIIYPDLNYYGDWLWLRIKMKIIGFSAIHKFIMLKEFFTVNNLDWDHALLRLSQ